MSYSKQRRAAGTTSHTRFPTKARRYDEAKEERGWRCAGGREGLVSVAKATLQQVQSVVIGMMILSSCTFKIKIKMQQKTKTEKHYPARVETIIKNDRETYYDLKSFVRQMRSLEQIQDWLKSDRREPLPAHLQKLYNYLIKYVCQ